MTEQKASNSHARNTVFIIKAAKIYDQLDMYLTENWQDTSDQLGKLCDVLPRVLADVDNPILDMGEKLQAWQYVLAYRKLLRDYNWWDKKTNQPKNWKKLYENTERNRERYQGWSAAWLD